MKNVIYRGANARGKTLHIFAERTLTLWVEAEHLCYVREYIWEKTSDPTTWRPVSPPSEFQAPFLVTSNWSNWITSCHVIAFKEEDIPCCQTKMAGCICTQTIWMKHPFICMSSWANTITQYPQQNENRTKLKRNADLNGYVDTLKAFYPVQHQIWYETSNKPISDGETPRSLPVFASTTIM